MKQLTIGLFGHGCVGRGLQDIVNHRDSDPITIKKICVRDLNKPGREDRSLYTDNKNDIFNDSDINIIVEVIDDADEAYTIVKRALIEKYPVITANKKMLATHYTELKEIVKDTNGLLLYDAAVCGAIPLITNLESHFSFDHINSIQGVFNGTTNYILTKQHEEGKSFEETLKDAQEKGFAETDPTADIDGFDAKYKLKLVIAHAYGLDVNISQIPMFGIRSIKDEDVKFAINKGLKIKLLSKVIEQNGKLTAYVAPTFVDASNTAYGVELENNYAEVNGTFTNQQLLFGKGAGSHPTGSAVFADLRAVLNGFRYKEIDKRDFNSTYDINALVEVFVSSSDFNSIEQIPFLEDYQSYASDNYFYKTGKVSLQHLHGINKQGLFVSLLSDHVEVGQQILESAEIH
ncbi:MAG: homoserine dehydrogenase [bacterium]|nr:homoserine dehydrogenase [bacterium]